MNKDLDEYMLNQIMEITTQFSALDKGFTLNQLILSRSFNRDKLDKLEKSLKKKITVVEEFYNCIRVKIE